MTKPVPKRSLTRVLALIAFWAFTGPVYATSGGTDSNGCHNSSSEGFHCHGSGGSASASADGAEASLATIVLVIGGTAVAIALITWLIASSAQGYPAYQTPGWQNFLDLPDARRSSWADSLYEWVVYRW